MTKYLIVSADDFGLSKSINEGIAKAHREGIVTFLNFMPSGGAFDDAVEFTRKVKLDEIGAHLSLSAASALSDPARIPTLIASGNQFHKSYSEFFQKYFLKAIDEREIYLELKAQLEAVKKIGVPVTSLSSHEHVHMMPGILKIFIKLAKEYNVPSIRCLSSEPVFPPISLKKIYKIFLLSFLGRKMKGQLSRSGINFTDSFLGLLESGNIQESVLMEMIKKLRPGTTELVCHPGFLSPEIVDRCVFYLNCETELHALTSRNVKELIREEGVKLIKFGALPGRKMKSAA